MSLQIITVTLNAAIDQTVLLEQLTRGSVQRALSARLDAGGKGINVASCLADWTIETAVTGLLGADNTAVFERLFAAKNIEDRCVRVPGETRTNIKLVDTAKGETTDVNLPGLSTDTDSLRAVCRNLQALCTEECWVVLSGSLPHGLGHDAYVELLAEVSRHKARAIMDTSGAALAAALRAPRDTLPYAIKPNRHELEAWAGRSLTGIDEVVGVAREVQALGIPLVVISLGEEGSLLLRGDEVLHAQAPAIQVGSTVGAGDAMVAGLGAALLAEADLETIARLATGFAAGKLGRAGPNLPARSRVEELARATRISRLS